MNAERLLWASVVVFFGFSLWAILQPHTEYKMCPDGQRAVLRYESSRSGWECASD